MNGDLSERAREQLSTLADDLKAVCSRIFDILVSADRSGAIDIEMELFTVSIRPKIALLDDASGGDSTFTFDMRHMNN